MKKNLRCPLPPCGCARVLQVSVHVRAKVSKARVLRSSVGEVLCKAKVPPLHAVLHPNEGAVPPARLRGV